jgi:glycosyltransferase involved in cell wall biosynthesis
MRQRDRIRVLNVVTIMNRGGIETWLMHILRSIDRNRFAIDFLTQTPDQGHFDEEIKDLGSKIFPCLHPRIPWIYAKGMRNVLAGTDSYHIVHSHLHHYNGFVLRVASQAEIPFRIAHSHTDSSINDNSANWTRRAYLNLSKRWISQFASLKLAASHKAALSLFGPKNSWNSWFVLPNGVDLTPFQAQTNQRDIRSQLGIPEGTKVIGHVGRFVDVKNHEFFVQIAAEIVSRNDNTHFLLVGDGALRTHIEQRVEHLHLGKHFSFLGVRSDVPRLLSAAFDAFLFPSLHEGLGLALVEAQAAGLPCFYSTSVPEEADVVHPLLHRISTNKSAADWAHGIVHVLGNPLPVMDKREALAIVQKSLFNIQTSLQLLERFYQGVHVTP